MAAATAANVNGLAGDAAAASAASVAPASPDSSTNGASAKRKRDASDDSDEVMADAGAAPSAGVGAIKASASASASPAPPSLPANGKLEAASNGHQSTPGPATSSTAGNRDEKRLIRDYFAVLQSFDKSVPPILKRPLPAPAPSDEPQAKRQKPDGTASPPAAKAATSVADKVESDGYALLDDLVLDVAAVVRSELAALKTPVAKVEAVAEAEAEAEAETDAKESQDVKNAKSVESSEDESAKRAAIEHINEFREMAYDLYRRETAYPKSGPLHGKTGGKINGDVSVAIASSNRGEPILTVFGNAPAPRQLFSSLPLHGSAPKPSRGGPREGGDDDDKDSVEDIVREDTDIDLGGNITLTRTFALPPEKTSRTPTFGELFPSPRNLPPLQPPKAPKSTTKSTTLGFYHPELVEKSKYRTGSYSTQHIIAGQWLDYSNATPSSQIKTRQRERAQSLAGHKPSTTELEMSEMEALFRGAFSSFAPSKDDSAAIVSAAQVGRMWWQRVGHRVFQRMVESDLDDDDDIDEVATQADAPSSAAIPLDEEALQKTIDEWDDSLIDPSLEQVMGEKSDTDKDVDEVLQDVSDLIITLASYQRNRNLTLPTSQDRFSADPVNADMLRNGTLAQQPSEEEMLTYQTLKAQLSLIIQSLPPYAVARLNSDKLAELNISTKIEVRSEEYRGILEEDESVVRARQAAQAAQVAVSSPQQRTPAHRSASASSNHSYGPQFNTPSRTPIPPAGGYYQGQHQTPGRVAQPHRPSVGAAGTPAAALPPHVRPGPPGQPPFRPSPNGYGNYVPALAKAPQQQQPPQFRAQQQPMPRYPGSPGQPVPAHMSPQRVVSQPQPGAYGSPALQPGTPQQFRYPPGTPGYPQQQVPLPPAQQPGMPQQTPQQRRPSQGMPYPASPANGVAHLTPLQRPIQPPPQHAASPQQRLHPGPMTPGQQQQPHLQQQQQQQQPLPQQQQPQQLMARPPYAGNMTPQGQAQQRQFSAGGQGGVVGAPGGAVGGTNLGPFGYHTVMDQPQQQRLMEQARARASAHERSLGFADKMTQGGVGQVAGLAGIGLGGGGGGGGGGGAASSTVDMAKLAAARANIPGGVARPGQGPQVHQPHQPHQPNQPHLQPQPSPQPFMQQQQQQQQQQQGSSGQPSPSPMPMSVSPAPSSGFPRPA